MVLYQMVTPFKSNGYRYQRQRIAPATLFSPMLSQMRLEVQQEEQEPQQALLTHLAHPEPTAIELFTQNKK
jgi:hypothetical protein